VKGIVRDELHKAGWHLADLLTQAVGSTSINSTGAILSPYTPDRAGMKTRSVLICDGAIVSNSF